VNTADTILHPFAELLRRYSFAYTAAHDFSVCEHVMSDDYVLRMGDHTLRGRDSEYKPATAKQYRQFPGLGFAVHEFICNGDRAALHFSEYGWSVLQQAYCAWRGISMYRWDGSRLVECRLEQDYYARRRQLLSGVPDPVMSPGWDPWLTPIEDCVTRHEEVVRAWLLAGGLLGSPRGALDDEHSVNPCRALIDATHIEVSDLFSAGESVVFQSITRGAYRGGMPHLDQHVGRRAALYATGIATVTDGKVGNVRAVTDRLGLEKRFAELPDSTPVG
jgi:predicted ester cyclase